MTGIIIKGVGGIYKVETADNEIYNCTLRGILRKKSVSPYPGDLVEFEITYEENNEGIINSIVDRETFLIRPQVANAKQIIIIIAADSPKPDYLLLDKMIIMAEKSHVTPIICVNKSDLDSENVFDYVYETYHNICGYKVLKYSAENLENKNNTDKLADVLADGINVFAGQSGVGKSSILNRIFKDELMLTGTLSKKISRGKHTTRHTELFTLPNGGYIADTPGFSSFEIVEIPYDEIHEYYIEFDNLRERCRFDGCIHINEPGCTVKEAVGEGSIDKHRYERYVTLYETLKQIKSYGK
jgi:ribosome biogenesis GTPase